MRNYSRKTNKKVTRFNTPSTFKVRRSEASKRVKAAPYHPPGRGHKTNIGRA
ncbi:MAG: hypothetical protein ABIJ91_05485 [Candidatus Kuenenbacteria bacterium]